MEIAPKLKSAALLQLIHAFKATAYSSRPASSCRWGYEVEYFLTAVHPDSSTVQLLPEYPTVQAALCNSKEDKVSVWNPEYAAFMIEGTPLKPFLLNQPNLGAVIWDSLRLERAALAKQLTHLFENAFPVTFGSFPTLGTLPPAKLACPHSKSKSFPTSWINPHPRFATLTANIVARRGGKAVEVVIPTWKDSLTTVASIEMDAMGFGMGCCCLQTTTEFPTLSDALRIYDQLLAFSPIALALSAASPIFKGLLAASDCRWKVIGMAVDDRTDAEKSILSKSRFSSASCYLSGEHEEFNDLDIPIDLNVFHSLLQEAKMSSPLAKHYAHMWIRDPLVAYHNSLGEETLASNENSSAINTSLVDNLQTTNWNTVRLKIPLGMDEDSAGWRVEFRPMEAQLNPFQNAALCVFVEGLIKTLLLSKKLNFVMPISMVDQNIEAAIGIDAILKQKFIWNWSDAEAAPATEQASSFDSGIETKQQLTDEDTDTEFFSDADDETCASFADSQNSALSEEQQGFSETNTTLQKVEAYKIIEQILDVMHRTIPEFCLENAQALEFVRQRALGTEATPARFIRNFVVNHPAYGKDSVVGEAIVADLLRLPEIRGE